MIKSIIFDLDQTLLDRHASFSLYLKIQYESFPEIRRSTSSQEYLAAVQTFNKNGYTPKGVTLFPVFIKQPPSHPCKERWIGRSVGRLSPPCRERWIGHSLGRLSPAAPPTHTTRVARAKNSVFGSVASIASLEKKPDLGASFRKQSRLID